MTAVLISPIATFTPRINKSCGHHEGYLKRPNRKRGAFLPLTKNLPGGTAATKLSSP